MQQQPSVPRNASWLDEVLNRLAKLESLMPRWQKTTVDDGHPHFGYTALASCTGDLTLGAAADVAGCTLTLPRANIDYIVHGVFDFDATAAPTSDSTCVGSLSDSANTPIGTGAATFRVLNTLTGRATVGQVWLIRPTASNYVVKLRASRTGTGGTLVAHITNTTLAAHGRIAA